MARLIRTEKEVEGRYEEVWLVVEEDALDQWPPGARDVVGQPATRKTGPQRARGEARFTADIQLPGMLHAAVLRSPHAHARVRKIDVSRALEAPGVRAAVVPGDVHVLEELAGFQGASVAAVAADTEGQARAALDLIDVEWEILEPLVDPEEAVSRGQLHGEPRRFERGDVEQGLAEPDVVVVEAEYRTQTVLHSSMETHQSVCEWVGDRLDVYISTQFIWGVRDAISEKLDLPPDKVRVVCEFMGGGFGSKNGPGDYTFIGAELAKRTGRPVRCALTRREENLATGNRNATIQRLRAAARADGTLVALDGEFVNSTGWGGWTAPTYGPMEMLYACENVRTLTYSAKLNTPPMLAFRAPGFVEGTFGLESLLDRLAAKLDIDPLELRKRNYADSIDDHVVLLEEPDGVLPARRAALGAPARGARPQRGPVEARGRPRQPDLVRRRRPTLLRMGAPRVGRARHGDHGHAGHRHGHRDRDGADRRRGARASPRRCRRRSRRLRPRPVRLDLGRLVDDAFDGTRGARRRRGRRPADHRDRGAALRPGGGRAVAEGRQRRLLGRRLVADRRGRRPAGGRAAARQGRARPEPDGHAGAHVRRPGRGGRRRRRDRARSASSASPRSTTSAG